MVGPLYPRGSAAGSFAGPSRQHHRRPAQHVRAHDHTPSRCRRTRGAREDRARPRRGPRRARRARAAALHARATDARRDVARPVRSAAVHVGHRPDARRRARAHESDRARDPPRSALRRVLPVGHSLDERGVRSARRARLRPNRAGARRDAGSAQQFRRSDERARRHRGRSVPLHPESGVCRFAALRGGARSRGVRRDSLPAPALRGRRGRASRRGAAGRRTLGDRGRDERRHARATPGERVPPNAIARVAQVSRRGASHARRPRAGRGDPASCVRRLRGRRVFAGAATDRVGAVLRDAVATVARRAPGTLPPGSRARPLPRDHRLGASPRRSVWAPAARAVRPGR